MLEHLIGKNDVKRKQEIVRYQGSIGDYGISRLDLEACVGVVLPLLVLELVEAMHV